MKSTSLPDGSQVQFNLIDKDLIKLLNEYTYVQLVKIPCYRRPHVPIKKTITARWFIKEFQRGYLPRLQKESDIPEGFLPVTELYNTIVYLSSSANNSLKPFEDYELRSSVLRSLLYPTEDENVYNNLGYCHDDSYLFTCLFEIIYKEWDLPKLERAVLNHCFGYSHKYRIMTQSEIAEKLKIPENEVRKAVIKTEKRINSLISKFKILRSYFDYRTNGELNGNVIEIRPSLCEHIKEEEENNIMTNLFIAKVISVTCDYRLVVICTNGRNHYLLIKLGMKDSNNNIKFYEGLKELLAPEMRTPETAEIFDSLVECMEEGYPEDERYFMEQEEYEEDSEILGNYHEEGEFVEYRGIQIYAVQEKEEDPEREFNDDDFIIDPDDLDDLEYREGQEN